jgi:dTDP-4-amino-4,6-dideoxygalactose transaminase
MNNPHQVTRDFEEAVRLYTGAPFAVAVNSCTMALLLACRHVGVREAILPKRTYVSAPMSVIHAGGWVRFEDVEWRGAYRFRPYHIYDAARRFTSGMFEATAPACGASRFVCVSFHASKILGLEQGGAILHDSPRADAWLRRARFDGREEGVEPKNDDIRFLGWHCYMNPSTAAQGILKLHSLPAVNPDLPNDDYPDLSKMSVFKRMARNGD